jgi:hypothetical protein
MPTNNEPSRVASAARACECGLGLRRPKRLSGLSDKMANGAPHSAAGSIAQAVTGLPFATSLAPWGEAGN